MSGHLWEPAWLASGKLARNTSQLLRYRNTNESEAGQPVWNNYYFGPGASLLPLGSRVAQAPFEEEGLLADLRRDYSALLFNRTKASSPPTQSTPWTLWGGRAPSIEEEPFTPNAPASLLAFQHVLAAKPYPFWSIAYRPATFVDTAEELYQLERAANNAQLLYWLNNQSTPAPPPIIIPPPPATGSPSGFVRGPIKRPDQIFGEQDPVSPWLGDDSRSTGYSPMAAERAAAANLRAPEMAMPSDEEREAVIALMRELL